MLYRRYGITFCSKNIGNIFYKIARYFLLWLSFKLNTSGPRFMMLNQLRHCTVLIAFAKLTISCTYTWQLEQVSVLLFKTLKFRYKCCKYLVFVAIFQPFCLSSSSNMSILKHPRSAPHFVVGSQSVLRQFFYSSSSFSALQLAGTNVPTLGRVSSVFVSSPASIAARQFSRKSTETRILF